MSDESTDKPDIWSPIQPEGTDVPFMSEPPVEPPTAPGFAAPVAPVAPPVAPSYIDVANRRSILELWGATFQTLRANFSAAVQMSAVISVITTALQAGVLVAVFLAIPGAADYVAQFTAGDFSSLETGELSGLENSLASTKALIGLLGAAGISVIGLFLMTFVSSGIFWVFVAPRAEDAEPLTFAEVRSAFFKSLPRMLSATVMWVLRPIGIIIAMFTAAAILTTVSADLSWLVFVIFLAGAGYIIWYSVSTSLTAFVVQSTDLSGNKSVNRSMQVVRGAWWRTVLVLLATNLIVGAFSSAVSSLIELPVDVIDANNALPWMFIALFSVSTFVGSLISVPLTAITLAHYYRDRSAS